MRLCVRLARGANALMHKGAPGLTLDNPVPHFAVYAFIHICGFHLREKKKSSEGEEQRFPVHDKS